MTIEADALQPGPGRSIWDELEAWSRGFAPWQRLLLATAVRSGTIPQAVLEQTYALFLAEHDLGETPQPAPEIPGSVTGRTQDSSGPVRLRRVHAPAGVNRLPVTAELTFADGLTVIFGRNGVGKSGFARILSNACFSRQRHTIYADIFDEEAPLAPSATIDVEDASGSISLQFDGVAEHAILKRGFVVFDSAVAQRQLTETSPLGFLPTGFDVFAEMARAYGALQAMLASDIQRRTKLNTFKDSLLGGETAASRVAGSLGRLTDLEAMRTVASFGDNERARINQLQALGDQLRAKAPDAAIRRLESVRPQLERLKQQLRAARQAMSEERLAADERLRNTLVAAATEVSRQGAAQFSNPALSGIGTSEWEGLVGSAQALGALQHVHYPSEGDVCLLCQQKLQPPAIDLYERYRTFVTGESLAALAAVQTRITARCAELEGLDLRMAVEESTVHSFLNEAHPTVLAGVVVATEGLVRLRDSARAALVGDTAAPEVVAVADFDKALDDVLAQIDRDLALLRQSDVPSSLKAVESERTELRHREVLSRNLDQMERFVKDARWVFRAENDARNALNPRHITEKEQELFAAVIAGNYRNRLAEECAALDCDVPVEFRTQGRRGTTVRSLAVGDRSPDEILSEGEQRAVALADFMTEVALNDGNAGIILDDPVTSLDHERKEMIAERLVREAAQRQVIIFTHDMVFFAKLCDVAEKASAAMTTHWMQRSSDNLPGMVTLNDGPTTTPQYRNTNFAEATLAEAELAAGSAQEKLVKHGAAQLRRTIEEIVPQFLFKEVVKRWTDRVMVTALRRINWDDALVDELVDVFEACSAIMEGHSRSRDGGAAHAGKAA